MPSPPPSFKEASDPPPPSFKEASDPPPPPPSFEEASDAGLADLVAMGFGREAAIAALATSGGSVQEATALLLDLK